MTGNENSKTIVDRFYDTLYSVIDSPVTTIREKIVQPSQKGNVYYHRRYRRVPTIDECTVNDPLCYFEANEQFKRDRHVDDEILNILRQRRLECEHYHGPDSGKYCQKVTDDYNKAEENWFIKYGDIGPKSDVLAAYMKQKHRMLWERRNGPVGTGRKDGRLSEPYST